MNLKIVFLYEYDFHYFNYTLLFKKKHIERTKKPLGRFIQRLLPIANTCKAHLDDIEKCMIKTLECFPCLAEPVKYCVVFKTSNNSSIKRDDVFRMVGTHFQNLNPGNKVNFDAPEYVLILTVICKMCFVSFVKNYFEYKKYNFTEHGSKFNAFGKEIPKIETVKNTELDEKSEDKNDEKKEIGKDGKSEDKKDEKKEIGNDRKSEDKNDEKEIH